MHASQEKILNYLLFFLLSLTGLASLLLVKNNYLYVFILLFLLLYWQRMKIAQFLSNHLKSPPSFLVFLTLGMVGVLLFQILSGSPRFYQRPILTLIISLIFYLPYFFLWYKLFLKRRVSLLGAFFFSGLLGVLVFGLLSGKLTTTLLTAPTLAGGLLYTLLKAAGILTVVGALTAFPFLFFSDEKITPLAGKVEKKNNAGFGLIEVLIVGGIFLLSLTLVGTARHRQKVAEQKLEQIEQNRAETLSRQPQVPIPTPTNAQKDTEQPRPQTGIEKEESGPPTYTWETALDHARSFYQTGLTLREKMAPEDFKKLEALVNQLLTKPKIRQLVEQLDKQYDQKGKPYPVDYVLSWLKEQNYDIDSGLSQLEQQDLDSYDVCASYPTAVGCEAYLYTLDPSDPLSPDYQQWLDEQWYYSQPSPEELFFNDPMQLWSQDPGMYEMFEGIYNFSPIPGLPDLIHGFP